MAIDRSKQLRTYALLAVLVPATMITFQNCAPFSAATGGSLSATSLGTAMMSTSQPVGSADQPKTLAFSLGSSGTTLALTIQGQSVGYSIASVTISSGSMPLQFSGFRIWVNGAQVANEPFSNGSAPMSAMSAGVYASNAFMINTGGAPLASDSIVVGFSSFAEGVFATPTPVPVSTATPMPTATPDPDFTVGVALYKTNCASCHGEIGFSSKNGRTAAQITTSLTTIPSMNFLKNQLSASDIDKIAKALK